MSTLKLGSLFSGYGGLDHAVHAAFGDITTTWVSDFDTGPNKILAHRYPDVPNLGDITQIDWTTVEPVDIIAGGFPCQDVSLAGRRAGMTEGTRSNLWGAMRTAIETIRPRYVVAENVRGLLSATATSDSDMESGVGPLGDRGAGHLRALGRVLGDLADLGYDAAWCGLRAADVGAPHGRFRVFIVAEDAVCGGSGGRASVASDCASERSDAPAHRPDLGPGTSGATRLMPTPRASDGAHGGPNQRGSKGDLTLPSAVHQLLPTLRATRGGSHTETVELLPTPRASQGMAGPLRAHATDISRLEDAVAVSLIPTDQASGEPRATTDFGTYTPAIARWETVLGRPAPSPTEHGTTRTRLSARFVEWMMGLPEGWVTDTPGLSRTEALKALGNGVVPQQGTAALTYLLRVAQEGRAVA